MAPSNNAEQEPMLLCLIGDEEVADRVPTALRYLLIGLIDEQIDAVLAAPSDGRCRTLISGPIEVLAYSEPKWPLAGWSRKNAVRDLVAKLSAMRKDGPTFVHALSPHSAKTAAAIAQELDADLLLTIGGRDDLAKDATARALAERASVLIAPSQHIAETVRAAIRSQRSVEVIRYGVTPGSTPAAFRGEGRSPSLVYAGPLAERGGIETLLVAFKRVSKDHPDLQVFLVGKGPGERPLRHLSTSLGLSQRVTFTGRLDYLRAAMESADIYCLPEAGGSFREEPLHAMAAGMAIIAPEESVYDGLEAGRTAAVYEAGNAEQLAERIRDLLEHREAAKAMGAACQALARSQNSVAKMVAGHVRAYRWLMNRDRTFAI